MLLFVSIAVISLLIPTLINYGHVFKGSYEQDLGSGKNIDLGDVVKGDLARNLEQYERKRKSLKFFSDIVNYFIFLSVGYLSYLFFQNAKPEMYKLYFFILLLIPILLLIKRPFFRLKGFTHRFKKDIIGALVKKIDSELEFYPEKFVPVEKLEESELYGFKEALTLEKETVIEGEDLIQGKYHGIDVMVSDVEAYQGQTKDLLFTGSFMIADFGEKIFEGKTFVVPDFSNSGLMNEMLHKVSKKKTFKVEGDKVNMMYDQFENVYDVYSTKPDEAKSLIKEKLAAHLLSLDYKIHDKVLVAFSFIDSRIYAGLLFSYLKLEPKLNRSLDNEAILEEAYYSMSQVLATLDIVKNELKVS